MWQRGRRRAGAGGGGELKGATATALLRPALETAVVVARDGQRSTPATPAPPLLRRYLNFAKLPDPALEVARRVLDDDEEFRARVAESADEPLVGRAGWLFLHRPDGWREELDQLLQQAAAAEIAAKDERHERGAQRRLAGAEAALARAEAVARARTAEAEAARTDLRDERLAARALGDEVERLRHEVDRLSGERAELIRRLKATEAAGVERGAELRAARHELRMMQAELAQAVQGGGSVSLEAVERAEAVEPGLDRAAVSAAVADATGAAKRLWRALAGLAELAGDEGAAAAVVEDDAPPAAHARRPRRQPVALPPAVFDDAPQAAEHLVRTPGLLVLVDGYNISQAQWFGLPPAEQRARLLDACGELHARVGVDIEVVFDGSGEQATSGSLVRASVRFQFTPDGVEADDVILARLDQEPASRPIAVVSSDRRVREGARQRGANVLGARQFLAVLRR